MFSGFNQSGTQCNSRKLSKRDTGRERQGGRGEAGTPPRAHCELSSSDGHPMNFRETIAMDLELSRQGNVFLIKKSRGAESSSSA